MPGNPNIVQGALNKIRASVVFASAPTLNVTAPFLGKRGLSIAFGGDLTVMLDQMTGMVTSPEPYLRATVTIHLIRSQAFAQAWKTQWESTGLLGTATIRPDSALMQPYLLTNCAIANPGDQSFDGSDADVPVRFVGTYNVNSGLFT